MIKEIIDSLRKKVPDAFLKSGEKIPKIPIKEKMKNSIEPIPFDRFYISTEIPIGANPWELTPAVSDVSENLVDDEELRKEAENYGTDALGWYQPFHFFQNWGIFIRWRGIKYLAFFLGKRKHKNDALLMKRAFKLIHSHEYFHFLTEWSASFLELIYLKGLYKDFFKLIYENPDLNVEESLANAYAYHQVGARWRWYILEFFKMQPPIYRNYNFYLNSEGFILGKRRLGVLIKDPQLSAVIVNFLEDLHEQPQLENLFDAEPKEICIWEVPIYIVFEKERPPQLVQFFDSKVFNVHIIAHPNDHKPRHIHIRIPANSRIEKRVCWPNYTIPLDPPPLSRSQIKRLEQALSFDKMKQRIDNAIGHIPICPPCS